MITFKKFTGINNVLPSERLSANDLEMASNVDIGLNNEVVRRGGYSEESAAHCTNVFQCYGFRVGTIANGDLVNLETDAVLYAGLGPDRVWYTNLPDGRTTFSNGLINGILDATGSTAWGLPIPATLGAGVDVAGSLFPGSYQWSITYVRTADGLEGAPAYSAPITIASGGLSISGLPVLSGFSINVYLTSHNGAQAYYAGNTATGLFDYTGANKDLVRPCRTDFLAPAPAGTVSAFWNGRVLVAVDSVLYASRHGQFELFDLRRDFKQFATPITLVQPVDGGVYVGTETELAFLSGKAFDKLSYAKVLDGYVVLGSGVSVDGEMVRVGDGVGQGEAMMCIADGVITAGFDNGQIVRLTEARYRTTAMEVAATFRKNENDVPQYIAVVQ